MKLRSAVLLLAFILMLLGCGGEKYPLNGVWSGFIDGRGEEIKITIAFIDEFCFLSYETKGQTGSNLIRFSYDGESGVNGSGFLFIPPVDENQFFVNGNVLNFVNDGIPVVLNKDVTSKAAPASIDGIWKDLEGWDMVFVNDRVYFNRDGTTDYGIFSFNGKNGLCTSLRYKASVEFTINGKILNAKVNGHDQVFSRVSR